MSDVTLGEKLQQMSVEILLSPHSLAYSLLGKLYLINVHKPLNYLLAALRLRATPIPSKPNPIKPSMPGSGTLAG